MSAPLLGRSLTARELEILRLALSTFRDGSGQESERRLHGSATRPGWRDFERVLAEVFGGIALERKHIFDVIVPVPVSAGGGHGGMSVKSKELGWKHFVGLDEGSRVYMELTNSPGLLFDDLHKLGLTAGDFSKRKSPEVFGSSILKTVRSWHADALSNPLPVGDASLQTNAKECGYVVVSMGVSPSSAERFYRLHGFSLDLPDAVRWVFNSDKCLRGYDPEVPGEPLYDWYATSGGQLKYYPRGIDAVYSTPAFALEDCERMSVLEKASKLMPILWRDLPTE